MVGHSLVVPEDTRRTRRNSGKSNQSTRSLSQPAKTQCPPINNGLVPTINVPTRNSFESLADITDDSILPADPATPTRSETTLSASTRTRKIHCPPIYVYGKTVAELNQLLPAANIDQKDYLLRVGRGCTQISIKTKPHFVAAVSQLRSANVQFYTHGTSDEVPDKFVLSGLPKYDIKQLETELKENNIFPTDVKLLSSSRDGDVAAYLLQFPKGSVKLQMLQKTRALFNVVVYWRFYTRKKVGAVQCFRCQQYGHGMRNCNLQAKCVKCGELHQTSECNLPAKADDHPSTKEKIRCANCSQNHTANFKGCPSRLQYLQKLEEKRKLFQRNRSTVHHVVRHNQSRLPPGASGINTQALSYANTVKSSTGPMDHSHEPDLFSINEFMALSQELFGRLSTCQSKAEQFSVLFELAIKHIYNVQP